MTLSLPRLELRNIKARLFLNTPLKSFSLEDIHFIEQTGASFRNKNQHQIITLENFAVFTVYKYSRHFINVTGLKSQLALDNLPNVVLNIFKANVIQIQIENMTFSRKVKNMTFSSNKMLKLISKQDSKIFHFDNTLENFHAPWIHSKYGSFNLFTTGSVTLVGLKTLDNLKKIEDYLDCIYCPESLIK